MGHLKRIPKGKIIAIEAGQAIIDIGYKMEGRVDIRREFTTSTNKDEELKIGDQVEHLERVENAKGEAVVSREKLEEKRLGIN